MAWPSSDKVRYLAWPSSDNVRNGVTKFGEGKEWHGQVQTR